MATPPPPRSAAASPRVAWLASSRSVTRPASGPRRPTRPGSDARSPTRTARLRCRTLGRLSLRCEAPLTPPFCGRLLRTYVYAVSYTHLRAHETPEHLVCRLLLEK